MAKGQEQEDDWESRLGEIHNRKKRSDEASRERLREHEARTETWISKRLRPALDSLAQALKEHGIKNVSRSGDSHFETLIFDVILHDPHDAEVTYTVKVAYTVRLNVSQWGVWGRAEFREVKAPYQESSSTTYPDILEWSEAEIGDDFLAKYDSYQS